MKTIWKRQPVKEAETYLVKVGNCVVSLKTSKSDPKLVKNFLRAAAMFVHLVDKDDVYREASRLMANVARMMSQLRHKKRGEISDV